MRRGGRDACRATKAALASTLRSRQGLFPSERGTAGPASPENRRIKSTVGGIAHRCRACLIASPPNSQRSEASYKSRTDARRRDQHSRFDRCRPEIESLASAGSNGYILEVSGSDTRQPRSPTPSSAGCFGSTADISCCGAKDGLGHECGFGLSGYGKTGQAHLVAMHWCEAWVPTLPQEEE